MKRWNLLFWIFMWVSQIIAQDYQITFAVLGGDEKPDSVRIENLDQGVLITLNGQDVLNLVGVLGLEDHQAGQTALRVYPNPVTGDAMLTFYNPDAGDVAIEVTSVEGTRLLYQVFSLPSGPQAYSIRGLSGGTYIISAHTEAFRSSAIVTSMVEGDAEITISIAHLQNEDQMHESVLKSTQEISTTIQMQFNDQEVIRFSSYLADYYDELELVPDQHLEIEFDFSPTAAFSVDKTQVLLDTLISFTDESGNSPTGWQWDFGDGSSSTEQHPTHSYTTTGSYTVSLTASNAYGSDLLERTDYIDAGGGVPVVSFSVDRTVVPMDTLISFTDESENSPTNWLWDFGDGSSSTEQDPTHSYTTVGTYPVSLTASNGYGSDTEIRTDYITVTEAGSEEDYIQFNPHLGYGTMSDIDDNTYKTIQIGDQVWMAENLRVTTYADSTAIPLMEDPYAWSKNDWDDTAYCWYDNDISYREIYGAYYTWGAAMHGAVTSDANPSGVQGVCPDGWHLPSDYEWKELEMHLGLSQEEADASSWRGTDEGGKLKETGVKHWLFAGATNESGFTGLPGGLRTYAGVFRNMDEGAYFHSSTEKDEIYLWPRVLLLNRADLGRYQMSRKSGFSVRCVEDRVAAPVVFFATSSTEVDIGKEIQFTDKSYNVPTGWQWDFGDGSSSTNQHPTHSYITPGSYTVSLTVSNGYGSDTEIKTDHITAEGPLFNPDLTYGTMSDTDDNTYKTIQIGNQVWMAENLRVTTYADGTAIPLVEDDAAWKALGPDDMAYCWYDNNASNKYMYGALYTWGAAMHGAASSDANPSGVQGVCPDGWHLPGDEEWKELEMYLGMSQRDADTSGYRGTDEGGKLKETYTKHWRDPNGGATNESGFTGIPAGYRHNWGSFPDMGMTSYFHSSTEYDTSSYSWIRQLTYMGAIMGRNYGDRRYGYAVRCVEDRSAASVAVFSASLTEVDPGEVIQFNDRSYNVPTSWLWDFGDGSSSTDQNPTHSYTALGSYTVSLIAFNALGSDTAIRTDYIKVVSPLFNPDLTYGTISDINGNSYKTIQIGDQVWMAENLRVTTYADNTAIPFVEDSAAWSVLGANDQAYCWYNNVSNFAYGALYTWGAAMHGAAGSDANPSGVQGVCPDGWHLPSDNEWQELEMYLGMSLEDIDVLGIYRGTDEGGKLKETGTRHWKNPNNGATNEYGFTGLPGGVRSYVGSFYSMRENSYFQTSTERDNTYILVRRLNNYYPVVMRSYTFPNSGFSVRCVEDRTAAPVAVLAAPSTEVDLGELIQFTDRSYNVPTSWQWDFGDGGSSTDQNPTHSYTALGTYTVSLEVSNALGSDAVTRTDYITVVTPLFNPDLTYGTMCDIDGNSYRTIQIGEQEWMAENLRVTRYADGTAISLVEDDAAWLALGIDDMAYCWYNNATNFAYGALYTWATAMHGAASSDANPSGVQGVCPDDWHLPSDSEWKELEMYLGMSQAEADESGLSRGTDEGGKLKETGKKHWIYNSTETSNESGFTGLPGGQRSKNGEFSEKGYSSTFASSTAISDFSSWIRRLYQATVNRFENHKKEGRSVRCVKD